MEDNIIKRLSSLERGKLVVTMLLIALSFVVGVCRNLYVDIQEKEKYIHTQDSLCDVRMENTNRKVDAANIRAEEIQSSSAKNMEKFMRERLDKAESLKENSEKTLEKHKAIREQALKNRYKIKTLMKNENR